MSNEEMKHVEQNQQNNKLHTNQSRKTNSSEFASDMAVDQTSSEKTNQKGRIEGPVSERTAWH